MLRICPLGLDYRLIAQCGGMAVLGVDYRLIAQCWGRPSLNISFCYTTHTRVGILWMSNYSYYRRLCLVTRDCRRFKTFLVSQRTSTNVHMCIHFMLHYNYLAIHIYTMYIRYLMHGVSLIFQTVRPFIYVTQVKLTVHYFFLNK